MRRLALNICTYHRNNILFNNLKLLRSSLFFCDLTSPYYGGLDIYVVDNAQELTQESSEHIHIFHNPKGNVGGSGGFQAGIEAIRAVGEDYAYVIFMDDDVRFKIDSFYKLFDFIQTMKRELMSYPIAGRMFCMDQPDIQYTAAEIWNYGDIKHIGFLKHLSEIENEQEVNIDSDADYGGWWFCCFPFEFVKYNDIMPFFLHCDDVEYGLRCGKTPIILKRVQVWHETFEHRQTPIMQYYDTRNPLFVNEKYGLLPEKLELISKWKDKITKFHVQGDYASEYYTICGFYDFMRGLDWLYRIDPAKYHKKLCNTKIYRWKNSIMWRITEYKAKKYIK